MWILYAFDAKLGHNAILGGFGYLLGFVWGEVGAIWDTLGHFGAFWGYIALNEADGQKERTNAARMQATGMCSEASALQPT